MKIVVRIIAIAVLCTTFSSSLCAQPANRRYGLQYDLVLKPSEDRAEVAITLDKRIKGNVWSMRFHIDPQRHAGFVADGKLRADGAYVTWTPPESGGRLAFHVPVNHKRDNGKFDALMTSDWAIFRGDDLFPPSLTDLHDDATSEASLRVVLPPGWSFAAPYAEIEDNLYEIEHEHRRFDRPTGWMVAGRLGVRRERIAGVRVVVAGPFNQGVRRMDILALLNWNLPAVRKVIPNMPKRLLVVSAGDPMWRGGLSGPGSIFLHADRPLLSENATSTLVHEVMHVANKLEPEKGGDWIVEGLAEYYSLKIMWRSGTITDHRYQLALDKLEKRGQDAARLDVEVSRGAVTARAVGILRRLDREIHAKTAQSKSLDDVMRLLIDRREKVSLERLQQAVVDVMGKPADTLTDKQLGMGNIGS